jgi:hypothetical protein
LFASATVCAISLSASAIPFALPKTWIKFLFKASSSAYLENIRMAVPLFWAFMVAVLEMIFCLHLFTKKKDVWIFFR